MSRLHSRIEALELAVSGQFQPCVVIRWKQLGDDWRQFTEVAGNTIFSSEGESERSFINRVEALVPAAGRKETLIISIRRFGGDPIQSSNEA